MTDFLDFNDITVKSKFKEKYKGVPGEKHRLAIIWPEKEDATKGKGPFVMKNTHFADKYFLCKDGICCEKLGPSKTRLACLVVKYKTKKDGTLVKREGEAVPFDFEIMEWLFADKKFGQLKTLHNEWDLKNHDIMVTCGGNEQYQDLDFTPCKESVWQMSPKFKEIVYKESEPLRQYLVKALGSDLTTDEIKELLGMGIAPTSEVISNEADLNDILSEV